LKKWITAIGLSLVLLTGCASSDGKKINSSENNNQEIDSTEDHRIIAGTVVVATILDKLNLDAVAVPETIKQLPSRFDGLPNIGNAMSPDPETIKMLNPTEFITVSTLESDLKEPFGKYKIPAAYLDLTSIEGMLAEINTLGERYNRTKEADALVAELNAEIESVQKVAKQNEKPRVLILLGVPGSYIVATEHSYAGDLVRIAGGENVIEGQDAEYLPSNSEYLYNSNPDIILRLAHGMPDEVVEMFDEEFVTNDVWKHFNAVKNDRVFDLEEELFGTTAALNVSEALKVLQEIFYN
jgi:iron complex transport system substrate-binding protein